MTYEDLLDWLEDEDNYDWDEWDDLQELYEDIQVTWSGRGEFPMSLDSFVNEFEDDVHNFVSVGEDVTLPRLELLINSLFD